MEDLLPSPSLFGGKVKEEESPYQEE